MKKRVLLLAFVVLTLMLVLVSCGHKHDFKQSEVITEATCDVAGKAKFVCDCGASEEREIAATGHTYGEEQVKEPTCWEDGYTYKVCSVCEAESEHTDTVRADSKYHKFDKEKVTKEPTCIAGGEKQIVCSVCGATNPNGSIELIAALGHDYERTETPATCSGAGSVTQICTRCNAPGPDNGKVLEQLPHTPEAVGNPVDATCEEAGYQSYMCTVCEETWDEETSPALNHDVDRTTELYQEPTCLLDGYNYYKCTRCDYRERQPGINGEKLGHLIIEDENDSKYAQYNTIVPATCITAGSITPICERCNETLSDEVKEIPATNVHFVEDSLIGQKTATCHEAAYDEYKCTTDPACTETEKRHDGEKLEHNLVKIKTVDPKCNAPGYDLYVCTLCELDTTENSTCQLGCVERRNETTIDHKKSTLKDSKDATCCKRAFEVWECEDCSEEWTYTYPTDIKPLMQHGVDKDGNDCWQPTNDITAPKCDEEGYTVYYCPNDDDCEATTNKDFTRRTEHAFTAYNDGRLVCNVCDATYRDITTYIDEAVSSGQLEIDADTMLDWELKGYENPDDPTALVANTPYVYEVTEETLDISNGIIKLASEDEATYTIVVEYGDGLTKTYNVDAANLYFDLYENDNVTKVTVTATADATVSLYAYEG